jgi:hypothetical protein
MPSKSELKNQKINDPQVAFEKPADIVKDNTLSHREKKKALETLEQDAHQLNTASNEGMAPLDDRVRENEPRLDKVVKAQEAIGEKPKQKPSQ